MMTMEGWFVSVFFRCSFLVQFVFSLCCIHVLFVFSACFVHILFVVSSCVDSVVCVLSVFFGVCFAWAKQSEHRVAMREEDYSHQCMTLVNLACSIPVSACLVCAG